MRILFIDIETAPNLAYTWGLWKQNIGLDMLVRPIEILSFAAKWYQEDEIFFYGQGSHTKKQMIRAAHKLLSEADAVVHFNGSQFDIPHLNREMILEGLTPPAPYKQIDLLKTCRTQFKFPSNKLAYVAEALGIGQKGNSGGFKTWIGCMKGEQQSWQKLEIYNIDDVLLTERLYERLRPWIKGHANQSIYDDENGRTTCCPTCAATSFQRRGYAYTAAYRYPRFRCKDCGSWFRGAKSVGPAIEDKAVPIA